MKMIISKDDFYPFYEIEDAVEGEEIAVTETIADIPEDKIVWIEETIRECKKVQRYLDELFEKSKEAKCS